MLTCLPFSKEKMENSFFISFLTIIFISNFSKLQRHVECLLLPRPVVEFDIVNKLIEATFNGYDCLNILMSNDTSSEDQTSIIKAIHRIGKPVSVRLIQSLENAIHFCGFLFISKNMEGLRDFANVRYDDVIRVLYIDFSFPDDADDLAPFDTDEMRLHDMDLALVKLKTWKETTQIFAKSRYENKTHIVGMNFSEPFFQHKNFVPTKVDYQKKIVRAMTFDCPIFSIIVNNEIVDGLETRIWREFERKLNFTAVTMTPPDDKLWGLAFPNGTVTGGILKALYQREADIGFCAFWIDFSKLWVSTFSNYWEFECLQFLIPKPKLKPPHWNNIMRPLPRTLWLFVVLGIIIVSSGCYLLRYIEKNKIGIISQDASIITEFMTVIGIFLLAKNPEKNHGQSVNRHVFMCWSLFALLITTLYSSSLVSHLTYPQFEPMVETVEGLVKAGYYWGTDYPIMSDRFMDSEDPWHAAFINSYRREADKGERMRRLNNGNYSIFVKIVGDRHFMEVDEIPIEVLRNLRAPRNCVFYFYLGFVIRKAFPLTLITDRIIRQLIEGGIIQYWSNRMFELKYPSTTFSRVHEYKTPPDEIELTSLRVDNLQGAFLILVVGIHIACIVFIVEILSKRKHKLC